MKKEFKTTEAQRAACVKWRLKLRTDTLMHYSNGTMECACCGNNEVVVLVIDHIDGNGREHRISLFGQAKHVSSDRMYSWLKKNGWPKGFQVLCDTCNTAKSDKKVCPCANKKVSPVIERAIDLGIAIEKERSRLLV